MMIRSMTGYGQAERIVDDFRFHLNIKSVNHRYHEVVVRMPREWLQYEDAIRKKVLSRISRGRVDVFVTIEREPSAKANVIFNEALAEAYIRSSQQLANTYGIEPIRKVHELLQVPDLFQVEEPKGSEENWGQSILACTEEALVQLLHMRETEGKYMQLDMEQRLQTMEQIQQQLVGRYPQMLMRHKETLRTRVRELLEDTSMFNEQRFATEIALMADRMNIDEELTRLRSHFEQFKTAMSAGTSIGRKLDFLIQEMNREINTIGAKSSDEQLVANVVDLKAELEKIREQVQNIE